MTTKYDILHSLVTLVKEYFMTMEEDDNQFKITCQRCNVFVKFKGRSGELLYITFFHAELSTIGPYPKELYPKISSISGLPEQKCTPLLFHTVITNSPRKSRT